ncbi:MAG: hypothetical protein DVB22_002313, partial [Verrucomicrobia bacterium]
MRQTSSWAREKRGRRGRVGGRCLVKGGRWVAA